MGDSDRIDRILALVGEIWRFHPHLRLCQLIGNCYSERGGGDLYYKEDAELEDKLKQTYKGLPEKGEYD